MPIQYPSFQPAMREITAISNSFPVNITTSFNNNYYDGLIVRLDIPLNFGMQQANGLFGTVTRIDGTHFSLPIDTTFFDSFIVPVGALQIAQSVPIGEDTMILWQATRDVTPNTILP
jgi:hypothetical protein